MWCGTVFPDIVDCINLGAPRAEKAVIEAGDMEMIMRQSGAKRPKLEDISFEEWPTSQIHLEV